MKKVFCILMFCGLIALSQAALEVTNGDFEEGAGGSASTDDVASWYDLNTGSFWESAWQSDVGTITANGTQVVVLTAYGSAGETDLLAGDSYLYQSIGTSGGEPSIQVAFDWGHPDDTGAGRIDTVTVSILASDGSFVAADGTDVYGAAGVTVLDSASYTHTAEGTDGEIWGEIAELDLSGANVGDELFLRFNSASQWPIIDNVELIDLRPIYPYDQLVTPVNSEGAVGNVVKINENPVEWEIQDVVLNWKAGQDANGLFPVNPDLLSSNIYLQTGAPDDPNLYLYDSVAQVSYTDPNLSYAIPNGELLQATTYEWQIEQVMDNGSGGYPAGDPNNIWGGVWSFTTASATPSILSGPDHTLTDLAGDATLEITSGLVADGFQWYEVVGEQDSDENGETDDILLTDSGIYSGTDTKILTISGAASDGSDDTRVYAIALNGVTPSEPSPVAWFWYPRLVNLYEFESVSVSDGNSFTPDSISGYDAQLMSADAGDDVPSLEPNVPSASGLTSTTSLNFDNLITNDPNNYGAQYAQVNEPLAGAYADITISAWVYWKGGGAWQRIYDYGNQDTQSTFICPNVGGASGQLRFAVDTPTAAEQNITAPTGTLPEDEWTHIAATLSGDTAKLYVNGEWVVTGTITSDPVENGSTSQNWLGRSQYGADSYFAGLMDNVKVWNYGLTNAEVADDYLSDTEEAFVCDTENEDLGDYDSDDDCKLTIVDFSSFAARWLEDDRLYPLP